MWARLKRKRLALLGLAVVATTLAVACSSAPADAPAAPGGGQAPAAQQVQATPTFPPTPVPPAIATSVPASAATAAPVVPASTSGIERGGHLRVINGTNGFPPKWDFSQTSTWISLFHYGGRAYNGLLQFSPRDGIEILPDMADSWESSNGSQTFTFHINPDLTEWHDGTPFTVDDIIFGIDRWRNPPAGIIQPRVGAFNLIADMHKIDDHTLEINLEEPFGDFVAEAANQWHMIIPKHILEANDNTIPAWQQIVGTGPFKIVGAEDGVSVDSVANIDYFRNAPDGSPYPYVDRLTSVAINEPQAQIAALRTKKADATKPTFSLSHVEYAQLLEENPGKATFKVEPFVDVAAIQLNG